jgi:hypothetical protein
LRAGLERVLRPFAEPWANVPSESRQTYLVDSSRILRELNTWSDRINAAVTDNVFNLVRAPGPIEFASMIHLFDREKMTYIKGVVSTFD